MSSYRLELRLLNNTPDAGRVYILASRQQTDIAKITAYRQKRQLFFVGL